MPKAAKAAAAPAGGAEGEKKVAFKQAQIEAAKLKAKEQRMARKAAGKAAPAAAKHAGKGR